MSDLILYMVFVSIILGIPQLLLVLFILVYDKLRKLNELEQIRINKRVDELHK